jgi:hypothetical protein
MRLIVIDVDRTPADSGTTRNTRDATTPPLPPPPPPPRTGGGGRKKEKKKKKKKGKENVPNRAAFAERKGEGGREVTLPWRIFSHGTK